MEIFDQLAILTGKQVLPANFTTELSGDEVTHMAAWKMPTTAGNQLCRMPVNGCLLTDCAQDLSSSPSTSYIPQPASLGIYNLIKKSHVHFICFISNSYKTPGYTSLEKTQTESLARMALEVTPSGGYFGGYLV